MTTAKRGTISNFLVRLTGSWIFWVLIIAFALGMPLYRSTTRELPPPPPEFGQLPEFVLIDETGQPYGTAEMEGKVCVVNFIFTSCGAVCPRLSERMAEVQARLGNMGDSVLLVSISVDPVRDTPEVLHAYGQRYHARQGLWKFLTGTSIEQIEDVVEKGFLTAVEIEPNEQTGFFDIVHGERFILVDQLGRIRGFYPADDAGIQTLLNTVGLLANRGPALPGELIAMAEGG